MISYDTCARPESKNAERTGSVKTGSGRIGQRRVDLAGSTRIGRSRTGSDRLPGRIVSDWAQRSRCGRTDRGGLDRAGSDGPVVLARTRPYTTGHDIIGIIRPDIAGYRPLLKWIGSTRIARDPRSCTLPTRSTPCQVASFLRYIVCGPPRFAISSVSGSRRSGHVRACKHYGDPTPACRPPCRPLNP